MHQPWGCYSVACVCYPCAAPLSSHSDGSVPLFLLPSPFALEIRRTPLNVAEGEVRKRLPFNSSRTEGGRAGFRIAGAHECEWAWEGGPLSASPSSPCFPAPLFHPLRFLSPQSAIPARLPPALPSLSSSCSPGLSMGTSGGGDGDLAEGAGCVCCKFSHLHHRLQPEDSPPPPPMPW